MSASHSAAAGIADTDRETWPWRCLACEETVFDDRDYCADCDSSRPLATAGGRSRPKRGLVAWMRNEPYPSFVAKVSVAAGAELVLTTLWLQVILLGPADLFRTALAFV